ncbi:MAG: hypothetical protein COZ70_07935 [Deltaproteobacteria bacterium CG_4_8_14_3_um_filter_51_11]|nr:ubiquinol-cytochrome c reductase iron-sulfur subunit [bacterium]NCP08102.1 ubiquinol-cytochrome c reductase iron-sulfur subunit [bacterium]PIV99660.1 MAG: hypothetical protein COW41_07380 [Deltaproteobacteria bacterium CG17_big_fil_post_rev_8_21_14_2_50_51_6]PIX19633.1 MAG: hypothetical protein COZ70_07935 [Deltaproteobacteria bacterium CG_4_8_14_3_um_filter_51_11]PIY24524.1 MAG: hypothetical protein COZ11_07335 [Deltaproteobacteria bacterium CG_4_10_14_3_um_filter_51_14]
MKRREFLKKWMSSTLYAAGAAALAYPALSFMTFRRAKTREVVFGQNDQGADINHKEGVYLIGTGDKIRALSAKCTHLGCLVNYNPLTRRFECPCHGSVYDITGKKLKGPTTRGLDELPLTKNSDGSITVKVEI